MTAPTVILLHPDDNVVVCARAVTPGEAAAFDGGSVTVRDAAETGHKLARRDVRAGEKVYKYGSPIGSFTADIPAGGWVHMHNMKSDYIDTHTRSEQAERRA